MKVFELMNLFVFFIKANKFVGMRTIVFET